ncbi:PREDICTED: leucokinin [Rhagoletis zephyria]|uniref:leucokinin n=1 Tax=Rhagoletis zephyria TaxID=28612 RepID=UPI0008118DBE|nr:PREDICTED: leucokinin [Rhagoletis zephyria]XP_036326438.1 leucokinin [Rhagoletis pomonella]
MYVLQSLASIISIFTICQKVYIFAQPIGDELVTCEDQLSKYRHFLLQAILSFEDVCDAYDTHPLNPLEAFYMQEQQESANAPIPRALQISSATAAEQRSEIWAFFKLLMAQFNDVDFVNIIKEAVIERCRIKSQQQHDEKRNSVVLGKKQRFHSWGGKRAHLGVDAQNLDLM